VTLINPLQRRQPLCLPMWDLMGGPRVELTVTDSGGLKSVDTCLVNVCWIISSHSECRDLQNVSEGAVVTLNGASTTGRFRAQLRVDPGERKFCNLEQPLGGATDLRSTSVSEDGESLMFQLMVKDLGGLEARDSCIVNVVYVNQPPVANAGSDQSVNQG